MLRVSALYPRLFIIIIASLWLLTSLSVLAGAQASYLKQAAISEKDGTVHLLANDSRPLAQALDALQEKYGWRVNYEDPQYTSKNDVAQVKGPADASAYPNGHSVPSGGSFVVEFHAPPTPVTPADERKILQAVVDTYNRSDNPGRFELREGASKDIFDIVGTAARDGQGRISPQPPLLDALITVTSQERTFSDTVDLICQGLADKSHLRVALGVHPMSLDRTNVTVGGKESATRAYLSRGIEGTNRRLVWRLLYDPDSSSYFLNVHLVKQV